MTDSSEPISGYAFVEAVSTPPEQAGRQERSDVVLDVIVSSAFDSGKGGERNPRDLAIVRIMSTMKRLKNRFNLSAVVEGNWFSVTFGPSPGDPPAWLLYGTSDYSGPITRINLIRMEPLNGKPKNSPQERLLADLRALCHLGQAGNFIQQVPPLKPRATHFVRVLDVGHANFSAIHKSRDADSPIEGYFDVGGPVFFHHHTFPKAFADVGRVPKRGFVALSHWDFDHYSLAVTKLKALRQLCWYAPEQDVGPSAARLQSLLGGNLTLLKQAAFQVGHGLDLWKGLGPSTDRNSSGYVMTASIGRGNALLTGDVAYDMIPAAAFSNLSALAITHHGGSGGGAPPSPLNGTGVAAVSFGLPNRYHHPDSTNLLAHKGKGWTVHATFNTQISRGDVWLY